MYSRSLSANNASSTEIQSPGHSPGQRPVVEIREEHDRKASLSHGSNRKKHRRDDKGEDAFSSVTAMVRRSSSSAALNAVTEEVSAECTCFSVHLYFHCGVELVLSVK